MRVLIDLTNSPHVPFFAPLVRELRSGGDDVVITARRFAQTIELAAAHELDAQVIGAHGGASVLGKARAAIGRTYALHRFVRREQRVRGRFDVAISHGSTDLPIVCRRLRIPHTTVFDYEWARTMHRINCRLSWRVAVPDAIPFERLDAYGAAGKCVAYPGLKEEYYLTRAALRPVDIRTELGIGGDDVLVVLRPPADMALYHRGITNDLFGALIDRVRDEPGCRAVLLPRTLEQRTRLEAQVGDDDSIVMPSSAVDGASLITASDVVVSAGGTMNREAAALGVPVHSVFAGRIGGVDEQLVADGRLRVLRDAADVPLVRRTTPARVEHARTPQQMLDVLIGGVAELSG